MTMGIERTLTSSLNATSSREDQFEDSFSIRSKYVLTAPFSELSEETFCFVDRVILCLTIEDELLVLKKTSEISPRFSLVRKHDLQDSLIMMHPLLPDAMRVQAAGTTLVFVYQTVKDSTQSCMKKWMSKVSACKAKAKAKRSSNTHSRNGPRVAMNGLLPKVSLGSKSKKTTVAKAASSKKKTTHTYSSPSSPAAQHRSILSAALASSSQLSSENSLQEEEQLSQEQEPAVCTSIEQLAGGSCNGHDIVITNSSYDDESSTPSHETPLSGERTTEMVDGEITMLVNGHADLLEEVNNGQDAGLDEEQSDRPVDLSAYNQELDLLKISRELRSSLRLDLKKSSEITRTASDRYLGHHRALSAVEQGTGLKTVCRGSSSASKLDDLKETAGCTTFENSFPRLNGEIRSRGSTTPTSPPLTPSTPRTPSPHTPIPPPSTEANGFFSRFHHIQIRNRKVKCSPRINRSISAQTPPSVSSESMLETNGYSTSSSAAMMTSSLVVTTSARGAEDNSQK